MATYQDVIDKVERELREHDAWPDASTKVQEQIDAIYRYALALSKELPLQRLQVAKSSALSTASFYDGLLQEADMPADVNDARDDLGILQVELEGDTGESNRYHILESVPFDTLKAAAENFYQEYNDLFTVDMGSRKVFFPANIQNAYVRYAAKVQSTSTTALGATIPLDDNTVEVLVEAVCAHFTSVNAKDLSASQIHSTLSQILKE